MVAVVDMVDIEKYRKKLDYLNLSPTTKELFQTQIKLFQSYNKIHHANYKIGDVVTLDNYTLIHGSRANLEELKIISKTGLIASEFYSNTPIKKKKPYVVELWKITENISLNEWLEKHTGVTIDFYNNTDKIYKSEISSFANLKEVIKRERGYRNYIIYQNQEQRFLPNELNNNECSVAFIIKYQKDNLLVENDIFDLKFPKEVSNEILPNWYFEKYIVNREYDKNENGREKAIIFGIPATMIEGIIISDKIKNNGDYLIIQKLFPNCYICSRDGKVLSVSK